jgi:hypothetical protein
MTDFGRRREDPPPGNFDEIEVTHLQVAVAAEGIVAERVRLRLAGITSFFAGAVEGIRRRIFPGRNRSNAEYEESRSEISTFLASCRRIF